VPAWWESSLTLRSKGAAWSWLLREVWSRSSPRSSSLGARGRPRHRSVLSRQLQQSPLIGSGDGVECGPDPWIQVSGVSCGCSSVEPESFPIGCGEVWRVVASVWWPPTIILRNSFRSLNASCAPTVGARMTCVEDRRCGCNLAHHLTERVLRWHEATIRTSLRIVKLCGCSAAKGRTAQEGTLVLTW
jgi:hypothetical protein